MRTELCSCCMGGGFSWSMWSMNYGMPPMNNTAVDSGDKDNLHEFTGMDYMSFQRLM